MRSPEELIVLPAPASGTYHYYCGVPWPRSDGDARTARGRGLMNRTGLARTPPADRTGHDTPTRDQKAADDARLVMERSLGRAEQRPRHERAGVPRQRVGG